jgi:hypothetical protein
MESAHPEFGNVLTVRQKKKSETYVDAYSLL